MGVRCSHQPSPWIGDYGHFLVKAGIVDTSHQWLGSGQVVSGYDPARSHWSPYYWNASLAAFATREGATTIELTSTERAAVLRVRFPPRATGACSAAFNQTRRLMVRSPAVLISPSTV